MIDNGNVIDWGKSSADYGIYRPGPPDSFYEKLLEAGIGVKNQKILDLGTGTGVLARCFAKQGAVAAGVDIANEQIATAKQLACADNLTVDFRVSPAEQTPFPDHSFDVITAHQCWLYFDLDKMITEVKRVLVKDGLLVVASFVWLPHNNKIAQASEQLILKYAPDWDAHSWSGTPDPKPPWVEKYFHLQEFICYEEEISFTREQWRGRIRASRATGATMSKETLAKFDEEHDQLLHKIAGDQFTVLHQIFARVLVLK